jgi:hypothetical protein
LTRDGLDGEPEGAPEAQTRPIGDLSASELDDVLDRDELRSRYYGLAQELRILLPGVQILVAFLLTVPFATRFTGSSNFTRGCYAAALVASMVSVIAFVTPTAIHRLGARRSRSHRLTWSLRLTVVGFAFFGIALVAGVMLVTGHVYSTSTAWIFGGAVLLAIVSFWILLPRAVTAGEAARPPIDASAERES